MEALYQPSHSTSPELGILNIFFLKKMVFGGDWCGHLLGLKTSRIGWDMGKKWWVMGRVEIYQAILNKRVY
jgi:hypothetical protein